MNATQAIERITADSPVQAVIEHHPQTVAVFTHHGLNCAGCYVSPFHTVADSAREYGVELEPLLRELNETISSEVEGRER